jgi:hypothetical protein
MTEGGPLRRAASGRAAAMVWLTASMCRPAHSGTLCE